MSWSKKYKKSIDCSNPKGFSQKAHCDGRKARQRGEETKSKSVNEMKITRTQLKEIIREEVKAINEAYSLGDLKKIKGKTIKSLKLYKDAGGGGSLDIYFTDGSKITFMGSDDNAIHWTFR